MTRATTEKPEPIQPSDLRDVVDRIISRLRFLAGAVMEKWPIQGADDLPGASEELWGVHEGLELVADTLDRQAVEWPDGPNRSSPDSDVMAAWNVINALAAVVRLHEDKATRPDRGRAVRLSIEDVAERLDDLWHELDRRKVVWAVEDGGES